MSVSLEQPMREAEIDLVELANANEAAIAQEVQDRISADTELQNNINAEEFARIAADATLQSNIDAEASAREAADATLQSNIDAEASAREAADATLQSNIDAEASAREAAVSELGNSLNTLNTTVGNIGDRVTTVEGHFPVATGNIADGAVTTIKLNDGIQNQLSFLASVPELEFGTSNSFNVQGSSYADVDVTFTTKTKEPIVLCGLQHATGNLNCIVTAVTNQQFSARVYNLTTTDVSDVTLYWLTISER